MSDLNYRSLGRVAFETYEQEINLLNDTQARQIARARMKAKGLPEHIGTWEALTPAEQDVWVKVAQVVTGYVAAADLA